MYFFTKHILYKVKPQYRKIAAGIPEADGMSFLAGVPEDDSMLLLPVSRPAARKGGGFC